MNDLKIPADYVLLEVEKEFENLLTVGGLTLQIDETYNPNQHRRIYGTVAAVPQKLRRSPMTPIDRGQPGHKTFVSSEAIEHHARRGLRGGSLPKYNCSSHEPDFYYLSDYVLDVEVGDKVYFHFAALEEENRLWEYFPGKRMYQIKYDQCICVVRRGKIIPVCSKALVVPVMQSWEEITSQSGILLQSDVKPKYLEGIITHLGEPLAGEYLDCKAGDKILYKPNADWTNTIEGKEYYVINQEDIMCVIQ